MKLNDYASCRKTWGSLKIPRSVQQSIPIDHIYEDGIWQSGNVYSMMWSLSDINYTMLSDTDKRGIQAQYGAVYASLPTDCWAKFCIVSQRMDEEAFRRDILLHRANDGLDDCRREMNRRMMHCVKSMSNVIQQKYLVVSTTGRKVQEARERLLQVRGNLVGPLSTLQCVVQPVTCAQRLQILHNFFRMGEEAAFSFHWDDQKQLGQDFRDALAPDTITFKSDHIEFDGHYAKCMSIMRYPQKLDDQLIPSLLRQVPYIVLSIDVMPVEPEDAFKAIEDARMKVDADKLRFNRKSVDHLDFTASVPHHVQEQEKNLAEYDTDLTERDQQMFLTLLTVAYFADTMEELETETSALKATAANLKCRFTALKWQQENAFNTAMPYGLRRIENMRTMVTDNVAALVPFSTQEILVPQGVFYGMNAVSGNLIVGDRTKLVNGNGIILGTSGGGKSAAAKLALIAQLSRYPKAHFYIVDPENEYTKMVKELGGVVVNIAVDSTTFFNPLDFQPSTQDSTPPYRVKAEFILSLCEQIMGSGRVNAGDRSLIDKALRRIYTPLIQSKYTMESPTLTDLWQDLQKQKHPRAQEIALALELFATGSMNAFAQHTNVDMSNRLICFNIQALGDQLKPVAMISMLEYLETCVMENEHNDPKAATWVYFDEMYLMLRDPLSAHYLEEIWKRFRKYNAYATGITQNLQDCLSNPTAYAMLANSEFVCILRQTKDIDSVVELYGLSEQQRSFLLTAQPGQGILKMGNILIQFENIWPQDNPIYRMITTKPGEM